MVAYGLALVDDPDRIGPVTTLGLDETASVRLGPYKRVAFGITNRTHWRVRVVL